MDKLASQIEKKVEVLKAFVNTPDEVVQQELALYKVSRSCSVEKLVRDHHVRILEIDDDCIVLEKTGHKEETQELLELLRPYGVHQFARTGLVAVVKDKDNLLLDECPGLQDGI